MKLKDFTNLFADSASSGKLVNLSITDFGENIQKAKISFSQVPLGIYRKGAKKKQKPIFHDEEKELCQLAINLTQKNSFYTSLRNFQQKTFLNFTPEDFNQGLYFSTFTFNNYQKKMPFSSAPWQKKRKCPVSGCSGKHFYRQVSQLVSSFLAGKKIAEKRLGRSLEGVSDLFKQVINDIQKIWKPNGFKYVAVPELHKCQISCHWKGKKHRKSSWKNHDKILCFCPTKHDCHRNWHIHMLSTNFLPSKYEHKICGLGKYNDRGSPSGCWEHRFYIAHDIWPYGLVDIKKVSCLEINNKPIKTAEQVVNYLAKYLTKTFQMRQSKELANQVGLLKGIPLYKFFRFVYSHYTDKKNNIDLTYIQEKIKKPFTSSQVFINNDYFYNKTIESELAPYFDADSNLKKEAKQILTAQKPYFHYQLQQYKLTNFLKLCLRYSTKSNIKKSYFWKPCDTSQDPIWKKGKGWQVHCPITKEHHTETLIRWEFEFKGQVAYSAFKTFVLRALQFLNLPRFKKFKDYQASKNDYAKFAWRARLPWNREINEYAPSEELNESIDDKKWQKSIPPELIYNYVYLAEIRTQIKNRSSNWEIDPEKAIARYADY